MNDQQRAAMQMALEALEAMLTHMGMDEDEWNKPTFDQSRKAIAALREALAQPQVAFSDCVWYTYIDFNEKPPYFRYDTGDNTAKENESTYYEIQEELKQFGYTIEDAYIDHDTICGNVVRINKESTQPQGEWVDLTDDEVDEIIHEKVMDMRMTYKDLVRAVIAAFKEKQK